MAVLPREEIFEKVKQTLIDALSVEDDEVTEDATLPPIWAPSRSTSSTSPFGSRSPSTSRSPQEELIPRDVLSNPGLW